MKQHTLDKASLYPEVPEAIRDEVIAIFAEAKATYPDHVISQNILIRQRLMEGWGRAAMQSAAPTEKPQMLYGYAAGARIYTEPGPGRMPVYL